MLRQEIEILPDVALYLFSDGSSPLNDRLPEFPDEFFWIFAADRFWISIQSVLQRLNRNNRRQNSLGERGQIIFFSF